jgi:hypothetical protein
VCQAGYKGEEVKRRPIVQPVGTRHKGANRVIVADGMTDDTFAAIALLLRRRDTAVQQRSIDQINRVIAYLNR